MIITESKETLPKNKSHPNGAEAVSNALKGVSKYESFSISFWKEDEYWASKYDKKLIDKGDITVLGVGCHAPRYEWKIYDRSFPSNYDSIVRTINYKKDGSY